MEILQSEEDDTSKRKSEQAADAYMILQPFEALSLSYNGFYELRCYRRVAWLPALARASVVLKVDRSESVR